MSFTSVRAGRLELAALIVRGYLHCLQPAFPPRPMLPRPRVILCLSAVVKFKTAFGLRCLAGNKLLVNSFAIGKPLPDSLEFVLQCEYIVLVFPSLCKENWKLDLKLTLSFFLFPSLFPSPSHSRGLYELSFYSKQTCRFFINIRRRDSLCTQRGSSDQNGSRVSSTVPCAPFAAGGMGGLCRVRFLWFLLPATDSGGLPACFFFHGPLSLLSDSVAVPAS